MWHREEGGICLPSHPYFIHSLQAKLELDDCDSSSHCISIVPESLRAKQQLKWAEQESPHGGSRLMIERDFEYWRNTNRMANGVDIVCRAGDMIIFNNRYTKPLPIVCCRCCQC